MSKSEPFILAHKAGTDSIEPWRCLPGPSDQVLLHCTTVGGHCGQAGRNFESHTRLFNWYIKSTAALSPLG